MATAATSTDPAPASVTWQDGELILTRDFPAPRDLVFAAWTRPEHFARWFGPHGTTLPHCTLDARPGGVLHFRHHHATGEDVWVRGVFDTVDAPERIAFTCWFSDPDGNRVERPGFPGEMSIAVTLAEHDGGTRMTVRQAGLVTDQGEVQGWRETMERLSELVAELAARS